MSIEIVCSGIQIERFWLILSILDAFLGCVENVTPNTFREQEVGLILPKHGGVYSQFNSISKHHVVDLIIISNLILREFEEQWLEESSSLFMGHWQLGIVISYHTIFNSHGCSHDIQVRNSALVNIIGETIRLLISAPEAVVVSWEWVESSNHVPSGA